MRQTGTLSTLSPSKASTTGCVVARTKWITCHATCIASSDRLAAFMAWSLRRSPKMGVVHQAHTVLASGAAISAACCPLSCPARSLKNRVAVNGCIGADRYSSQHRIKFRQHHRPADMRAAGRNLKPNNSSAVMQRGNWVRRRYWLALSCIPDNGFWLRPLFSLW